MKYFLFVGFITLLSFSAKAQQRGTFSSFISDTAIFTEPQVMPKYPDGVVAMIKFIDANRLKTSEKGIVYVTFIVEKDGSLSHIRASKGVSDDTRAEAVRVVSLFKKWTPGLQDQKPVRVGYVLPIRFN